MSNIFISSARLLLIVTLLFMGPGIVKVKASNISDSNIRVILDANLIPFSEPPYIENSTTLVQFRPIFENLGLEVSWNEFTRTVKGRKQGVQIELQIDNPVAKVNGNSITLSVAPKLKDGNTFVPLRFISESVESKVEWNDASRTVVIYSKNNYASADGKFHFTAYGLWRNMGGLDKIKSEVDERVQDFVMVEDVEYLQLALRYFNYTMLFISAEPDIDKTKDMDLIQYLDRAKKKAAISNVDILGEKQIKLFGFDARQLTYVNNNDWDKRVDTLIVFKSDSQFYSIRNSSYEVTYKSSILDFHEILESMDFQEK
ncbi:copper amine oxidase N-terminal domain-containing protein [Paenibacillus sp. HWE-109]|uniref:copper amine oxidase N-terminal domain-containing protein n=1 Tax=Paenibacillus sp. HWE-109 TaxID=1306526 RepID=UPI001EDE9680|nr:copper amine oxidase N-terminal domain-containing protein [Paenibacillus sp. HWE-109]UKS27508.1 copper amine oxidase N-terminal domain-containing protein [Paenibacillus sp. HWE-109]